MTCVTSSPWLIMAHNSERWQQLFTWSNITNFRRLKFQTEDCLRNEPDRNQVACILVHLKMSKTSDVADTAWWRVYVTTCQLTLFQVVVKAITIYRMDRNDAWLCNRRWLVFFVCFTTLYFELYTVDGRMYSGLIYVCVYIYIYIHTYIIKKTEMGRGRSTCRGQEMCIQGFVGKSEWRRPLRGVDERIILTWIP